MCLDLNTIRAPIRSEPPEGTYVCVCFFFWVLHTLTANSGTSLVDLSLCIVFGNRLW
jgi:hypothetical protein